MYINFLQYIFHQSFAVHFPSILCSTFSINSLQFIFHNSCTPIFCSTVYINPLHYIFHQSCTSLLCSIASINPLRCKLQYIFHHFCTCISIVTPVQLVFLQFLYLHPTSPSATSLRKHPFQSSFLHHHTPSMTALTSRGQTQTPTPPSGWFLNRGRWT